MKLHLPSGLRAALFACFAAFAGIGTTLSTATITGGVFAVAIAGQSVHAADYIGAADIDGTKIGYKSADDSVSGLLNDTSLTSDDTITYNGVSGWLPLDSQTYNANIKLEGEGLNIVDGSSGRIYVFNGALSGSGNFTVGTKQLANRRHQFKGDVSGFTGAFSIITSSDANPNTLEFINEGESARVVNASSITVANVLSFTGDYAVANAVSAGTLKVEDGDLVLNGSGSEVTNLTVNQNASLTLGATASLTLNGTVTGIAGSVNNGTVTFGDNAMLTLDDSMFTEADGTYTLALFTGTGTMTGLTKDKLDGILIAGREYTINPNGTISYTITCQTLSFTGGELAWNVGAEMTGGQFADGDIVTFTGDTVATMGAPLSAAMVTVEDGVTLSLSNGGVAENTLEAENLIVNGTLTIKDAVLAADSRVTAESTGTVVIDAAPSENIDIQAQLTDFAGTLTVQSGRYVLNTAKATPFSSLNVKEGGQLDLTTSYAGAMSLEGHGTGGDWRDTALRLSGGNTISGKVTIEDAGSSIAVNSGDATISGELAGTGDFKKTEGGTLYLTGNITNTGTLNIQGGKVSIGSGPNQTNSMSFSNINVGANCTLQFQHAGANFSGTDVTLNGGTTLHLEDSNCGNTVPIPDPESKAIALGKLTLTDDAKITWNWKGAFSFTELTGAGNLTLEGGEKGNDPRATIISSINNYNGTISGEPVKHVLYLGSVHQDAGNSAVIKDTNTIYTSSFSKTGAGDLVIVNDLAISGALTMNYEGGLFYNEAKGDAYAGLSIASVADGTILSYTKATGLLTLDAAAVGESTLYLDLLGVADSLATGINLGIANTVAESQLKISGISGGTLSQKDGSWWYTGGAIDTPWDINWDTAELATAPATVPVKSDVSGTITMGDTDAYHTEGSKTSAIHITGTQEAGAYIYGGYDNAGHTTSRTAEFDSWIKMTGGDVFQIVGGNNCSAWQNSSAHNFKGDSHILVEASGAEGATAPVVDYIIGGNYKDGYGTTFTGDSFISIKSNSLQGAVAGGNAQAHGSTATFVGDSHIYIYTPQTLTADTDWVASGNGRLQTVDAIIGGNVKIANVHGTLVFNGDTNIVLDFDGYAGEAATMAKDIIGGSYNGAGNTSHTGNTNITIRNADTTTFSKNIVGGSWMGGNTSTISGTATVDISSGIFTGMIVGGHYASTGNSNYSIGGVEMNLSGGTYKGDVYAAGFLDSGASTVTTGSTTVTIGSGATLGTADAAITVSGGYGRGTGATGGTVTGDRLLNLAGTHANATFKDFDKVTIATGEATARFELAAGDTLTKVGAGTLSLNGGTTYGTMAVQEGTLALNGQTLTATTVAGGATLDGSVAGSNAGALTLDGTVKLNAGSGIALGSLTLAAGSKIEVLGTDSLGDDYTLTLFTGLSQDKITGITFTTEDDSVKANLADYISNADAFVGGEIYLNKDGSLVITNGGPGGVWKWDTPDAGEWKADSTDEWETGTGTTTEGAKVAFGKDGLEGVDSTTVTISGEVKPATVTVDAAEGKSYVFEADAEGSGIASGTLEKEGAGTLVLETANSSTGAMTVTDGTVQIGSDTAAGDWAGDIAVNGSSVLDVQEVADSALGTITAEAGATVKVADDVTISALNGGKLENSAAVTLSAASTLDTLDNAGSITTGNNITVGTVTNGGSLDAKEATVTLGSDATFSKLSAGAVNAGDTKLTLTGDSTVDTIGGDYVTQVAVTGGKTDVRTGGVWTKLESVQLSDTGSSLLDLTASVEIAGSVTTGAAAAGSSVLADNAGLVSSWNIRVGTINEGTENTEGDANVAIVGNLAATNGGIYVRGNVDVDKTAADTFGDVTAGSVINIGGAAAVEGTLTAGQDVTIGGAATVGGDLKSTGAAVAVVGDATVGGALDGSAYVTVGGKATVGGNVASNGTISISGVADVDGSVTSHSGPVIISGVATIGGNVSAAGNVTLDAGGTIGDTAADTGDLSVGGTLGLGGTVDVGGTVSGVTQINVADSALAPADSQAPVLEAKAWTGNALTMAFESKQSVLNLGIEAGGFYTLLTTTVAMDPLALTLVAPAEAGIATLADEDATSFTENAIRYSLEQSDDKFSVLLTATYVGKDWVSTDGTWTTDEAGKADWSSGEVPGADADVVFNGKGLATVSVEQAVSVQSITIDTAANAATTGTAAYTVSGADGATVTTQVLSVVTGGLTLDGAVIDAGAASVGRVAGDTDATLAVGEGSTLNATSLQVHGVTGEGLGFSNAGTVAVSGMLTVTDKDKALDNAGALSFGDGSALGKVNNTGTLTATAGTSSVDELVAAGNLAATGDAVLNITAVAGSIDSVTLADASTITVGGSAGDAVLNVVALSGSANSTFSTTRALALGSATTQGGHVVAASLDLTNASGSTLASLSADALTLNVGAFDGNALLTLTGTPANSAPIALTLTGMDNAATTFTYDNVGNLGTYGTKDVELADGSTYTREWTTYTLVNAVAGYDWTLDATQKADLQQLFALAGTYAQVEFKDGNVLLNIYKDEPRDWVSSNPDWAGNETNNNGEVLDVTKIAGTYTDFDTVDAVKLDGQNAIIDLTDRVDANNVLANATDVTRGVVLRDVQGEGNLYLMGDAATGAAKDLVTLSNLKDGGTELKGQLFGNSIAIQVEGAGANTGLTVDSIELWESSVLTVLGTGNLTSVGAANLDKSSVIVQDGGSLTIEGDTKVKNGVLEAHSGAQITAGAVTLADAGAALIAADGSVVSISSLNGTAGTVIGSVVITGKGGNYSGGYVDATLVLNGAQQTLAAKSGLTLAATGADATLTCAGADAAVDALNTLDSKVTLDNVAGGVMSTLTLGETSTMKNGELAFGVKAMDVADAANYGVQAPVITDGAALNLSGTKLTITQADTEVQRTTFDTSLGTEDVTLMTVSADGSMDGVSVSFGENDKFFSRYFENIEVKDGKVVGDLITDRYSRDLAQSENGTVGLQMMDAADLALNPMGMNDKVGDKAEYADLAGILHSLEGFKATGDADGADKLGAAVAGSGVASLGMALAGDVERQLRAIRNRTTTMGVDPAVVNDDMPYFNAWINAEGDHRSLDEDSTLSGYSLSSWGGTVGFDMDVNPSLTWGLAVTAMYGDFTSESADQVEGDVNTYYVSAFARATSGAWVHTFVATMGMSKSELERTVSHSGGSYTTEGEADGMSFGFLYEVGRTFALNEDATACWQPVFNVSYRHTEVDAFSESGSDAALECGDQSLDTLTFGLGGRLQAIVGENIYNRTSILEARALVKLDAGDRQSEMNTALGALPSAAGTVKSAEMDAFGIEVGAGLTVPMGIDSGSIFMDASVEFRGSYTSVNGTLGYRINF